MGKGDQKTRRGKINNGSYGKSRPKKSASTKVAVAPKAAKPKKEAAPKAEKPKKVAKPKEEAVETKPKTIRKKKTEE
jgi:30S ribosomal protein S31